MYVDGLNFRNISQHFVNISQIQQQCTATDIIVYVKTDTIFEVYEYTTMSSLSLMEHPDILIPTGISEVHLN